MPRLRAACLLLSLLFLTACANPLPAATPTHTPAATPAEASTTIPTAVPHNSLTVPYWLSFDYPAGWHRIYGRAPGFAGVASRDIGILPENRLSGDTALFYAFQGSYQSADPLAAMQDERLARLNPEVEIVDPPAPLALGDLQAASLRYRFTLEDGEPGIVRLTLVRAPDGRYAELWAISREPDAARYAPLFDNITASLTLHDMLPAPTLPPPAASPPTAYRPVPDAGGAFTISVPPDWRADEADFGLVIRPSAIPDAAHIIAGPVPAPTPGAGASAVLETIANQLLPQLIYDAVRISPIAAVESYSYPIIPTPGARNTPTAAATPPDATASIARAYYAGTDQNQPRFIILHTAVSGDHQLYALALLPTTTLLPIAESILNTLTP